MDRYISVVSCHTVSFTVLHVIVVMWDLGLSQEREFFFPLK